MTHKFSLVAAAAMTCLCLSSARADDGPTWKFSGFGTAGVAHSSERQADFVGSLTQPNGAGATRSWSMGVDSKLGGQVDLSLNPHWSASVQLLSRHQYDNSYTPELSLAFVKWAAGNGLELRAGRVPYAAFVVSDYRNIGYSQPWARPPLEVYSLSTDHVDGMDATWRSSLGGVGIQLQGTVGSSSQKTAPGTITAKEILGANLTADWGSTTARLSYLSVGKLSYDSEQTDTTFAMVRSGLPANALYPGSPAMAADPANADKFELKNKPTSYLSLGLSYDPGAWFVNGEFGRVHRMAFNATTNEFYLTAGIRLGAFTPYAGVAELTHPEKPTSTNPVVQSLIDSANANEQKSFTLGLRWDFAKSADLKIQFDRISNGTNSHGLLTNLQPGFVPGKRYSVVSVAIDFVF